GQLHQQSEVGGRVHRGADQLRVVQVEATHVEAHPVAAERPGDDPPAAFAQPRQARAQQVPGDDVEHHVDPLRGGGVQLFAEVPGPVDDGVGARLAYGVRLRGAAEGDDVRPARPRELYQGDAHAPGRTGDEDGLALLKAAPFDPGQGRAVGGGQRGELVVGER